MICILSKIDFIEWKDINIILHSLNSLILGTGNPYNKFRNINELTDFTFDIKIKKQRNIFLIL